MKLQVLNNTEFGSIKTAAVDGEPWFVGKDVSAALGYTNLLKAVRDHVDDEDKGMNDSFTPGGKQKIVIINDEDELYELYELSSCREICRGFYYALFPEITFLVFQADGNLQAYWMQPACD